MASALDFLCDLQQARGDRMQLSSRQEVHRWPMSTKSGPKPKCEGCKSRWGRTARGSQPIVRSAARLATTCLHGCPARARGRCLQPEDVHTCSEAPRPAYRSRARAVRACDRVGSMGTNGHKRRNPRSRGRRAIRTRRTESPALAGLSSGGACRDRTGDLRLAKPRRCRRPPTTGGNSCRQPCGFAPDRSARDGFPASPRFRGFGA
jgi:hypothetical protein